MFIELGANDDIQSFAFGNQTNYWWQILNIVMGYGAETYVLTQNTCGTNAYLFNIGWTDAQDAIRKQVNAWLVANPQLYTKLIDRAHLLTRAEMSCTNGPGGVYTRDNLHPRAAMNTIQVQQILGIDSATSPTRMAYDASGNPTFTPMLEGGVKLFSRSASPTGYEVGAGNCMVWCSNGYAVYRTLSTDGTNASTSAW